MISWLGPVSEMRTRTWFFDSGITLELKRLIDSFYLAEPLLFGCLVEFSEINNCYPFTRRLFKCPKFRGFIDAS
jgi:hypothetical protein